MYRVILSMRNLPQKYSSSKTAGNGKRGTLPAIFKMISIPKGALVLDYGGGTPESEAVAQKYLDQFDAVELLYDKFNQTPQHNDEVEKACLEAGGADICVCSNMLNVIYEPEVRIAALEDMRDLVKPGGKIYITVYTGSGSGQGAATQQEQSYQLNQKLPFYLEEVKQIFPGAYRQGQLIIAPNR